MSSSDNLVDGGGLEAQAAQRRKELGEALAQMALAMLRNGADAAFVQQ
jgi:hypothetical protein